MNTHNLAKMAYILDTKLSFQLINFNEAPSSHAFSQVSIQPGSTFVATLTDINLGFIFIFDFSLSGSTSYIINTPASLTTLGTSQIKHIEALHQKNKVVFDQGTVGLNIIMVDLVTLQQE